MLNDILVFLASYFLGSIPSAFLITLATTGKDVRDEGDGNMGTRNAMRVSGLLPGLGVLLLDGGKGAAAYWVAQHCGSAPWVIYGAGLALMVGQGFPIWLPWRGGKGLAAASGFLAQVWPAAILVGVLVLLLARKVVSFDVAFGLAAGTFLLVTVWQGNDAEGVLFVIFLFGLAGLKGLLDRSCSPLRNKPPGDSTEELCRSTDTPR